MYGIRIGEISEARMRKWRLDDDNPFDVIEGKPILEGVCTIDGVLYCQECLREEVDVDWSSSASTTARVSMLWKSCSTTSTPKPPIGKRPNCSRISSSLIISMQRLAGSGRYAMKETGSLKKKHWNGSQQMRLFLKKQ